MQRPRRQKNIETRTINSEKIILRDLKNNHSITLAPIAAIVWEFCDGLNTTDSIVESVSKLIGDPPGLHSEIRQLLNQLAEAGFLSLEPDSLGK